MKFCSRGSRNNHPLPLTTEGHFHGESGKPVPGGYYTITPQLTLDTAARTIEWHQEVTMAHDTSVLIAGGSLNGLTTALLLAERGVPCVLVERHPRTTLQYKFRGISPRSMEIYRSLGIEDDIRARNPLDDTAAAVGRMANLAAEDLVAGHPVVRHQRSRPHESGGVRPGSTRADTAGPCTTPWR